MNLIPDNIFTLYNSAIDDLLTSDFTSYDHTIYYPSKKVACDNCITTNFGGISKNVFRSGASSPFTFGNCPLCGGNGYREEESTDTIRTRVYWQKKDWITQGNISIPNADVMIMGHAADLPKILRMNYIKLINTQTTLTGSYALSGTPFYHGFGLRYFVAFLKQV